MAVKITLKGSSLHMFLTGSEATVRYKVDLDPADYGITVPATGTETTPPDIDENSMVDVYNSDDVPDFGSYGDFDPISVNPYGPEIDVAGGRNAKSPTSLRLRVEEFHIVPTDNSLIQWLDVIYRSRPMPTIDFDSSLTQKRVETYLGELANPGFNGSASTFTRKQMALDYTAKANAYFPGFPSADQLLPKVPVSASKLQFGQSVRLSSTWYDDEVSEEEMSDIMAIYGESVNSQDLFFAGDSRMWLCTNMAWSSNDGGWKRRMTGELVFNIDGWDTPAVYTDPFTKQPVILSDSTVKALYEPLSSGEAIPLPYLPDKLGAAKFPQHQAVNLVNLYLFLRQSSAVNFNNPTALVLPPQL